MGIIKEQLARLVWFTVGGERVLRFQLATSKSQVATLGVGGVEDEWEELFKKWLDEDVLLKVRINEDGFVIEPDEGKGE